MRQTGVVLQYRLAAGFGFIKTSTGQSLFFHIKQVRDGFLLEPGDSVAFTIGPSTKQAGKSGNASTLSLSNARRRRCVSEYPPLRCTAPFAKRTAMRETQSNEVLTLQIESCC